jgi:hypothetical protein
MNNVIEEWINKRMPIPAPTAYKIQTILTLAKRFNIKTFIETGTYIGTTVEAVKGYFEEIHSIELGKQLYVMSIERFKENPHIHLYYGASENVLPNILEIINVPCLFWLDAHDSAGLTARGEKASSLYAEIPMILSHHIKNHIILVDDTNDCSDSDGYLSIDTIKKEIREKLTNYIVEVEGYILRAYPNM